MAIRYQELGEARPTLEIVKNDPTIVHAELAAVRALLIDGQFGQESSGILSVDIRPLAVDVAINFFAINPQVAIGRFAAIEPIDLSLIHDVVAIPRHAERFAKQDPGLPADFVGLLQLDAELNGKNINQTARVISDPIFVIPVERVVELQNDLLGSPVITGDAKEPIADNQALSDEIVFDNSAESAARQILNEMGALGDGISLAHLLRTNRRVANDIMKLGLPVTNEGRSTHITIPFKTLIEAQVRSSGNPRAVRKAVERLMYGGQ